MKHHKTPPSHTRTTTTTTTTIECYTENLGGFYRVAALLYIYLLKQKQYTFQRDEIPPQVQLYRGFMFMFMSEGRMERETNRQTKAASAVMWTWQGAESKGEALDLTSHRFICVFSSKCCISTNVDILLIFTLS